MKKNINIHLLSLFSFVLMNICFLHAENNPMAVPSSIVHSGNARFTVLTPEMIRIEWSEKQQFEDRASFVVVNRNLPLPSFKVYEKNGYLFIKTAKLVLQYKVGTCPKTNPAGSQNLKITFPVGNRTAVWYPGKKDPLNLKGTARTLDGSNADNKRSEMGNGLLSRSGWAVIDEYEPREDGSNSFMLETRQDTPVEWFAKRKDPRGMDLYFMGYGYDYKKALYDFTRIAGKIPLPPMWALGYWYSKYQRYDEQDFKDLVNEMESNGMPLDVMVVDTDWHINGWTGWSWNRELFPNPEEFLSWLHKKDLKVTLNLHPAYGVENNEDNFRAFAQDMGISPDTAKMIPWYLEDAPFCRSFLKNILHPLEKMGVDFWWLDWQQWLISQKVEGLGQTFWINHVFYKDMENQNRGRSLIFHRWGGLGNHRYQLGFSGDSHSNFPTLAFQPYFTATASNVGYGYWGHDLGGHYQSGDNNPELFLRWIQYGVFTPVFRTHSSNAANIERRMWKYSNFNLMKEALELRYALAPYIYTQARKAYDTGISICRPLYYDYPHDQEAYRHEDTYMFGDDILVNPVVTSADLSTGKVEKNIWLPKGRWYEVVSGKYLEGNRSYQRSFEQKDIPYYYKEGSIIPNYPVMQNLKHRPDKLILKFVCGAEGETFFYEDENDNDNYRKGAYTFTHITQKSTDRSGIYTIYPPKGCFNGMPLKRSYAIELFPLQKPKVITVNKRIYTFSEKLTDNSWNYDEKRSVVYIQIPTTSCQEKIEIHVK